MSKNVKSLTKVSRRLGVYIGGNLKAFNNRPYAPGQFGQNNRRRVSDYGVRLQEKQKIRFLYGGLREKQFLKYFKEATRRKGNTGLILLQLLEQRLDNVIYRAGFAKSRPQARQLVRHKHVTVNGTVTNIPSFQISVGDQIEIRERSRNLEIVKSAVDERDARSIPDWLQVDSGNLKATIGHLPEDPQIEVPVDMNMIIEFYSR